MGALAMVILTATWALSECQNAGDWPGSGFGPSWGISKVWNCWIIYPAIAGVLLTAAGAWWVFGRKPISEGEIRREIERQAGHAELQVC